MKVVTFGEILLRLQPQGYKKLFQNDIMETSFCGAEANVAVSLQNFGINSTFVSKVPSNEIGYAAINSLRYFGVNTNYILKGDGRLGLYYLEKGASQRPSKIYYDRANSTFSEAFLEEFNWEEIFNDCDWFHFTGIIPALGENLANICIKACKIAKEKGITISCDINYRSKLWSMQEARNVMSKLMGYVDVCIGNEEDAEKVFGICAKNCNIIKGDIINESYMEVAREISHRFGCKYVAISNRTSLSASINKWSGIVYIKENNEFYKSKEYEIQIVDRVGSGDSFAAGIIYSIINELEGQDMIEFAVAASCIKHTQEGDFNRTNVDEVLDLVNGDSSGRIRR